MHVPLIDRLGSCSLVCTAFARAAAAATEHISIEFDDEEESRQDKLMMWLDKHGHFLTSLELHSAPKSITGLGEGHLPRLKELALLYCTSLQLGVGGSQPGVLQACTRLTYLALTQCDSFGVGGLDAVSLLVNLQFLHVHQADFEVAFPGTVLPSLVHLTYLILYVQDVVELHHLSCLSNLCELELSLPQPFSLTPSIAPEGGFSLPASLQSMWLRGNTYDMVLDSSLLQGLTGLTSLDLFEGSITASNNTNLLGVLPALQRLQQLRLHGVMVDWPAVSPAYSALIPSTALTALELRKCTFPAGAYQHLFAPGRVLPHMRHLIMHGRVIVYWDQAAVVNVVSCCPGLQELDCVLQAAVSVAPLGQLSGLKTLTLECRGSVEEGRAFMQGVAALTNLQTLNLCWQSIGRLGLDAFVHLTALKQLTRLHCWQMPALGMVEAEQRTSFYMINQADPGAAPDVWLQLLEQLGRDSSCQPLLTRSLGLQLAQQDAQIAELQQSCTSQQQELQQQGAAARAEAGELRGQLQTLQDQVQQLLQHRGGGSGCG